MYVKDHPRLINEIPRGSKRYKDIKKLRSSSERINSALKEDLKILDRPRVLSRHRSNILAQMAGIVLLLKRAFSFIVKVTMLMRKFSTDPLTKKKFTLPSIPASILNIINRRRE